jgi:hypothetical protein
MLRYSEPKLVIEVEYQMVFGWSKWATAVIWGLDHYTVYIHLCNRDNIVVLVTTSKSFLENTI